MPSASTIRHWIAGSCVFISVLMVIGGLTVFASGLKEIRFILYWLICAGFTGLAALIAVVEIFSIRRQSRELQKKLVKETLSPLVDDEKT